MLVLSRHVGQSIIIGRGHKTIKVKIIDIQKGTARLGIEADKSISVHREEVLKSIQRGEKPKSLMSIDYKRGEIKGIK